MTESIEQPNDLPSNLEIIYEGLLLSAAFTRRILQRAERHARQGTQDFEPIDSETARSSFKQRLEAAKKIQNELADIQERLDSTRYRKTPSASIDLRRAARSYRLDFTRKILSLKPTAATTHSAIAHFQKSISSAREHFAAIDTITAQFGTQGRSIYKTLRQAQTKNHQHPLRINKASLTQAEATSILTQLNPHYRSLSRLEEEFSRPIKSIFELSASLESVFSAVLNSLSTTSPTDERPPARASLQSPTPIPAPAEQTPSPRSPFGSLPIEYLAGASTSGRSNRVALVPVSTQGAIVLEPSTRAPSRTDEIGQLGEKFVFEAHHEKWSRLAEEEPARAAILVRKLVNTHWSLNAEQTSQLEELLLAPELLPEAPLFQSILWPASTGAGDAIGFDIFGLEEDRRNYICLEVKTTEGTGNRAFELTANEWLTAKHHGDQYVIVRIGEVRRTEPTIALFRNPVKLAGEGKLHLTPTRFQVQSR